MSSWNDYLKVMAVNVELSNAQIDAFLKRFKQENLNRFDSQTVDCFFQEYEPYNPQAAQNYKKHMSDVLKKFQNACGLCYNTQKDRTIDLFHWLEEDYQQWQKQFWISRDLEFPRCSRVDELLRKLDYARQEAEFRESVNPLRTARAFLVRADNDRVQNWLVKRLFLWIPKSDRAKSISINIDRYLRNDFDREFWQQLAEPLKLSEPEIQPDRIIAELCEFARTQPLILMMFGVRRLGRDNIEKFFQTFWHPLVDRAAKASPENRSPIILFLAEDADYNCPFDVVENSNSGSPEIPIALTPLPRFETADVKGWLGQQEVGRFFETCLQEDGERRQVEDLIDNGCLFYDRPDKVLDDICWLFGLEEGMAAIEKYWKLVG